MTATREICAARDRALRRLRDAHRDEYDNYYHEALGRESHPCRICGASVWTDNAIQCGELFCREAWCALRYVVDERQRTRQLVATARWVVAQGTASPAQLRRAQRVVDGGVTTTHGRWLIEGSRTYEIARECIERGLPIVDEFPDQIVKQLHDDLIEASA